jgi:hypothetical protein
MNDIKQWISSLLIVLWAYVADIHGTMLAIGMLIFIDTLLGVYKSRKLKRKITSRRLSAIISKMLLYQGAVISIYLIDKNIMGGLVGIFIETPFFITKLTATVIALIELYSIKENLDAIAGKSIWQYTKSIITRTIREVMEVKGELNDKDDNII